VLEQILASEELVAEVERVDARVEGPTYVRPTSRRGTLACVRVPWY
jgi:hypothetical protein